MTSKQFFCLKSLVWWLVELMIYCLGLGPWAFTPDGLFNLHTHTQIPS